MVKHQCLKCNRDFKRKEHLDAHLKKKNPCKPKIPQIILKIPQNPLEIPQNDLNNPNVQLLIKMLTTDVNNFTNEPIPKENVNLPKENVNLPLIEPINEPIPKETINLPLIEPINEPIPKEIIKCNYCNDTFARKNSLYRHVKQYCPVVNQQNKEKQEIFEQLKMLESKNKQLEDDIKNKDKELKNKDKEFKNLKKEIKNKSPITNNTIVNGFNNITNNIVMVSYGQEDLSKISAKMLSTVCKRGYNSVPQLIEMVHFNPIYPEFHNVYIPSVKDKHAMVYDGNMWELKNKDEVVSEMYDNNRDFILDNISSVDKLLNENEKKSLHRWIDSDKNKGNSDKDKKAIDYTCEQLKLLLHNKRHIPMTTRKQLVAINN